MKDNREPPEKKSRVLTQILKEIDSEKKTNTPKAWGNWNNWGKLEQLGELVELKGLHDDPALPSGYHPPDSGHLEMQPGLRLLLSTAPRPRHFNAHGCRYP